MNTSNYFLAEHVELSWQIITTKFDFKGILQSSQYFLPAFKSASSFQLQLVKTNTEHLHQYLNKNFLKLQSSKTIKTYSEYNKHYFVYFSGNDITHKKVFNTPLCKQSLWELIIVSRLRGDIFCCFFSFLSLHWYILLDRFTVHTQLPNVPHCYCSHLYVSHFPQIRFTWTSNNATSGYCNSGTYQTEHRKLRGKLSAILQLYCYISLINPHVTWWNMQQQQQQQHVQYILFPKRLLARYCK